MTAPKYHSSEHFDMLPFIGLLMCVLGVLLFVTLSVAALAIGPNVKEGWLPIDGPATLTNTLLTAQDSLHHSVQKLHDAGFEETLKEFRDSLTALRPVLENLREPFILQAVPIRANGTSL